MELNGSVRVQRWGADENKCEHKENSLTAAEKSGTGSAQTAMMF